MAEETNQALQAKTDAEQLQETLSSVRTQIKETESIFQNAKNLVTSIETYYKSFEELKKKLDDDQTGLSANLAAAQTTKNDIGITQKSAEADLNSIRSALNTVQENIEAMKTAYAAFEAVNAQVAHPDKGLAAVLKNANELKDQVEKYKIAASEGVQQMETNLTSINGQIATMNDAFKDFEAVKAKVEDKDTGLMAIFAASESTKQEIIAVKKQSDTLFQEIKKFRDESQNYHKEISVLKIEAETNIDEIKKYETESQEYKTKIGKIYKLATDSSLANSFDARKRELKKSQWVWLGVFILSTSLLAFVVYKIFMPVFEDSFTKVNAYTWYRLTITSPLLFLVAFASTQYAKERNLLERYSFKAATAFALESYTTLLTQTFEKEKNSDLILKFVLDSMRTIYQEPYEPIKESTFSLGLDGKLASIKADFTKKMDDTARKVTTKVEDETKKVTDTVKEQVGELKAEETKV